MRVEIENLLADKTIVINKENSSCLFYLLYIYTHVAIDIKDSKMVNNSHLFYNKLIPILQPLWKDITDFELKKRLDAKIGIYKNATINYNLSDKSDDSFYLWDKLGRSLLQEGTENKFLKTLLLRAFLLE